MCTPWSMHVAGGRAHGIHEDRWTGKPVEIGQHVRQGAGVAAIGTRTTDQHVLKAVQAVMVAHRPDQHPDVAVEALVHLLARIAGVFEGFDPDLQEQAYLG
jgi:hypothetical protein